MLEARSHETHRMRHVHTATGYSATYTTDTDSRQRNPEIYIIQLIATHSNGVTLFSHEAMYSDTYAVMLALALTQTEV